LIVLLRNGDAGVRYVVVVALDGEVQGSIQTALGDWEHMFSN
jgi:hypothetical protein